MQPSEPLSSHRRRRRSLQQTIKKHSFMHNSCTTGSPSRVQSEPLFETNVCITHHFSEGSPPRILSGKERHHARSGGSLRFCLERVLKLVRRTIIERRMEPRAIVVLFDELLHAVLQVFEVAVGSAVNLFGFERLKKTLAHRIVIRVGRSAHARQHLILAQPFQVRPARVLNTLIPSSRARRTMFPHVFMRSTACCRNSLLYRSFFFRSTVRLLSRKVCITTLSHCRGSLHEGKMGNRSGSKVGKCFRINSTLHVGA